MVPPFTARAIVGRRSKYLVIVFWLAVELGRPAGVLAHSSEVRNRRADDDGAMGPTGEPHRAELPAGMGSPVVVIAEAGSAAPARNLLAATPGIVSLTLPVVRNGLVDPEGTRRPPPDSQAAYDVIDHLSWSSASWPLCCGHSWRR